MDGEEWLWYLPECVARILPLFGMFVERRLRDSRGIPTRATDSKKKKTPDFCSNTHGHRHTHKLSAIHKMQQKRKDEGNTPGSEVWGREEGRGRWPTLQALKPHRRKPKPMVASRCFTGACQRTAGAEWCAAGDADHTLGRLLATSWRKHITVCDQNE